MKFQMEKCSVCNGTGQVPNAKAMGLRLRHAREKAGIGLRLMASRLHLSAPYVSDLERGNRKFSPELLERYQHQLNIPVNTNEH